MTAPLWVGPEPPEGIAAEAWLPAAKARTRLGGEHDLIVFDALSPGAGFDPDAFGALSGTLRAGGLLVLLTPGDWGARPDADYARLAAHPHAPEALSAHYLARLARLLEASPRTIRWPASGAPTLPDWPEAPPSGLVSEAAPDDPDCLTADQAEAVARLVKLRRRRPLVLTADRGRGKTAALGIACARLLAKAEQDGAEIEILVTAPRPSAVAGLFERLAALRPEVRRQGNRFEDVGGRVTFLAPDELSARVERGGRRRRHLAAGRRGRGDPGRAARAVALGLPAHRLRHHRARLRGRRARLRAALPRAAGAPDPGVAGVSAVRADPLGRGRPAGGADLEAADARRRAGRAR